MKNNKKFWILFAIIIALSVGTQLVGQEVKETTGEKVVKTIQDWDFKKYEAAHKRAHMKMNQKQGVQKKQMVARQARKKMRTRRMIQTLVVAGVSYYIGYKVGEDSWMDKKKDGGKKPIIWRDK
jgi:phosphate/sulfate permease